MMDKLDALFQQQRYLNADYLRRTGTDYVPHQVEGFAVKENVLAAIVELTEILRETNWKSWRGPTLAKPDWPRFRHEVVDLVKFSINLALIGGMDADELHRLFTDKTCVNDARMVDEFRGSR